MGQLRRQVAPRRPEGAGRMRQGTNRSLAPAQTLARNLSRATPSGFLPPCFHTSACPLLVHPYVRLPMPTLPVPLQGGCLASPLCLRSFHLMVPCSSCQPPLSSSACWSLRVTSCPRLPGIEGVPCD